MNPDLQRIIKRLQDDEEGLVLDLTEINLSGANDFLEFTKALHESQNLTGIRLVANQIGHHDIAIEDKNSGKTKYVHRSLLMAQALINKPRLQTIRYSDAPFSIDAANYLAANINTLPALEVLNLAGTNVGKRVVTTILDAVKLCQQFAELVVDDKHLAPEGKEALTDFILERRIQKSVAEAQAATSPGVLDLAEAGVADKHLPLIGDAIRRNCFSLVILADNKLTTLDELVKPLKSARAVSRFIVANNKLDDAGVWSLIEYYAKSKTLLSLLLHGNKISDTLLTKVDACNQAKSLAITTQHARVASISGNSYTPIKKSRSSFTIFRRSSAVRPEMRRTLSDLEDAQKSVESGMRRSQSNLEGVRRDSDLGSSHSDVFEPVSTPALRSPMSPAITEEDFSPDDLDSSIVLS